jgi:hypothetical protein
MLASEKENNLSWQIRTKDGQYYQPESLGKLYKWIFENRLGAEDLVFDAQKSDWSRLSDAPAFRKCFWELMTEDGKVFGPLSLGEIKHLYAVQQIGLMDKVSIYGDENWTVIKALPFLKDWFEADESVAIDYVQFVEGIEDATGITPKEEEQLADEKPNKKINSLKQQNSEYRKKIKEIESKLSVFEKELSKKSKLFEEISSKENKLNSEAKAL